tara:strand:- start:7 stop:1008 length:1002 start_codon:yes stop_codon:yes gene_type:complete
VKNKIIIIAEAGVNHNGKLTYAKKLALMAKNSGADIIKFQIFKPELLVSKNLERAPYQKNNKENNSQLKMLKKLQLSDEDFFKLKKYCDKIKIKFMASVFDEESLNLLRKISKKYIKIGSSESKNFILLKKVAKLNSNLFLSLGMCDRKDIKKIINFLKKSGQDLKKVYLMHCNTAYPTPKSDINLLEIKKLNKQKNCKVGYSDHSIGILTPCYSVILGAVAIEKHITLNKKMNGPDHKASLNYNEFRLMINNIRNLENILKYKKDRLTKSELKNFKYVTKFFVAKTNIKKNEKFSYLNLTSQRTGKGIEAHNIEIIGRKSKKYFKKGDIISI